VQLVRRDDRDEPARSASLRLPGTAFGPVHPTDPRFLPLAVMVRRLGRRPGPAGLGRSDAATLAHRSSAGRPAVIPAAGGLRRLAARIPPPPRLNDTPAGPHAVIDNRLTASAALNTS